MVASRSTSLFAASPMCALAVRDSHDSTLVDSLLRNVATPDGRSDRVDRRFPIGRHQQHIGAGLKGQHCRFASGEALGDAAHLQRIGHDDSLETQFFSEHFTPVRIFRRKRVAGISAASIAGTAMCAESSPESVPLWIAGPWKGRHSTCSSLGLIAADGGQVQMRIGCRIAVSGEVSLAVVRTFALGTEVRAGYECAGNESRQRRPGYSP